MIKTSYFSTEKAAKTFFFVYFMRKIYNVFRMITMVCDLKMEMEQIAKWAYLLFVVIAVVMGLAVGYMVWDGQTVSDIDGYVTLIMLILGVIIGLTSITAKEVTPFLIATIALVVAGTQDVWGGLSAVDALEILYWFAFYILRYIVAFAAPAAVIISIRSVLEMAKEK